MPITALIYVRAKDLGRLGEAVTAKIADDYVPFEEVTFLAGPGEYVQAMIQGTEPGSLAELEADIDALQTNVGEIETWSGTLATKLNADVGVTDEDFAGVTLS